jgi:hypothetical protein
MTVCRGEAYPPSTNAMPGVAAADEVAPSNATGDPEILGAAPDPHVA